jgi:DnaJ-class molecular chaperone
MERTYSITKNEICGQCRGEGVIIHEGYDFGHGHSQEPRTEKCSFCNGTGMVTKKKEINISITPKQPHPYGKQNN